MVISGLAQLANIIDNHIMEGGAAFLGQLIGAFIITLILSYLTRWVIKKFSPETVGIVRVGLSVGIPLLIAFFINPSTYFIYAFCALIIGLVFYKQEVKKMV